MTKEEFNILLSECSKKAIDFASKYVSNDMPFKFKYDVRLNVSNDNPNLTQFDIYPEDNNKTYSAISHNEVVDILVRKNKVPVWIDIFVDSTKKDCTLIKIWCSGRFSDDSSHYYYNKNKTACFGIKSPNLPIEYREGEKFKLPSRNFFSRWLRNR